MEAVYVDRVDTAHVQSCPHGFRVSMVEILGVKVFQHPDGEPCSVLNNLQLAGPEINEQDAHLRSVVSASGSVLDKLSDPEIYSRLGTDKGLIARVARELDRERSHSRLADGFLEIARGKNAVEVFRAIGTALGSKKYELVLRNVAAVYMARHQEEDLSHLMPLLTEYVNTHLKKDAKDAAATS